MLPNGTEKTKTGNHEEGACATRNSTLKMALIVYQNQAASMRSSWGTHKTHQHTQKSLANIND